MAATVLAAGAAGEHTGHPPRSNTAAMLIEHINNRLAAHHVDTTPVQRWVPLATAMTALRVVPMTTHADWRRAAHPRVGGIGRDNARVSAYSRQQRSTATMHAHSFAELRYSDGFPGSRPSTPWYKVFPSVAAGRITLLAGGVC